MKTVLFLNQKGGCGKTLLADEVAHWYEAKGKKVNFYDLDAQGGTVHETKEIDGAEISVVDTPGALHSKMREWIESADLVIIPTRSNRQDMGAMKTMMDIIKDYDKKKFIIVFNQWNRFRGAADFKAWFNIIFPGFDIVEIPMSVTYSDASALGISIFEYQKKGKAAEAMRNFMNLIDNKLGEE